MITLAKIVQTSVACPSQWDAWTADGTYVHLRYRYGLGLVEVDYPNNGLVHAQFDLGDDAGNDVTLDEFLAHVADTVEVAPDADIRDDRRSRE